MKRLLLGGASVALALTAVGAHPVRAHEASKNGSLATWVNPVLEVVPTPKGWDTRSVCVGDEATDRAWCFYFPWPV
jgi:hypothetical protein